MITKCFVWPMESWNFCRIFKRAPDGESKTVLLDSNRITHLQFWTEELKLVVFLYYCDISCFVKNKKKKRFEKLWTWLPFAFVTVLSNYSIMNIHFKPIIRGIKVLCFNLKILKGIWGENCIRSKNRICRHQLRKIYTVISMSLF